METKPGGEGKEGREERVAITAAANVPAVPLLHSPGGAVCLEWEGLSGSALPASHRFLSGPGLSERMQEYSSHILF